MQTAAYDDYFTSLQTQIAGGSAPDTFELNYENFVTYARSGALLDLTDLVTDPERYYPLALEGFSDGGVQYGLPATFSDVVLIYNKDLFDAAGLDYPTADWTWADEQAAAEAAHRHRRRRVRRLPAGELLRVLQGAAAVGRRVLRRQRPGRVQLAGGRRGGDSG